MSENLRISFESLLGPRSEIQTKIKPTSKQTFPEQFGSRTRTHGTQAQPQNTNTTCARAWTLPRHTYTTNVHVRVHVNIYIYIYIYVYIYIYIYLQWQKQKQQLQPCNEDASSKAHNLCTQLQAGPRPLVRIAATTSHLRGERSILKGPAADMLSLTTK